jgi:hypothetical protein
VVVEKNVRKTKRFFDNRYISPLKRIQKQITDPPMRQPALGWHNLTLKFNDF